MEDRMSNLGRRISKLEGRTGRESTLVLLCSWVGDGEYHGVRHGDSVIRRRPDESEEAFLDRAENELLDRSGNPPVLTCFAIRQSELEAA